MSEGERYTYCRYRWGEPPDIPLWVFYELDWQADAVLRTVDIYADGRITRNSIEIEQRHGDRCPSLADHSLDVTFKDAPVEQITREEFEQQWVKGTDQPFWFVR